MIKRKLMMDDDDDDDIKEEGWMDGWIERTVK